MHLQTTRRITAVAMAGAATLAIAGFTALGSIFDYPKILKEPVEEILNNYRDHQTAISGWFLALVISAALLAPVGFGIGKIAGGRLRPWITGVGIAAATVQVIGLSRWVLLVPGISDDATVPALSADAHHRFEQLHFWLGTIVGETIGYALTATFTVLVVIALSGTVIPKIIGYLGYASAALIATGVLIPLGLSMASLTNFAGYLAWCLWLIAMAVVLWRPSQGPAMFTATATIQVRRPVTEVFAFIEDARNRPQWDDTVISEEITSTGPITVGTTVRTKLRSMGREYTYAWVVTEHRAPERMTIQSVIGPLPTTLQFTLTGDESHTRVEFTVTGRPAGFLRLLQPIMARSTQRNLDRNFAVLGRLLETGSVASPAG